MLFYIHIPFCDSKCNYCSFVSYTNRYETKRNYINSLNLEIKYKLKNLHESIETLYIGGGTPSTLEANFYEESFEILKDYFSKDIEITIEANPNSANLNWLENIKKLGVNRVSFGVQSFNNEKLLLLGRNHTKKDVLNAINSAKKVGFENISCDLIFSTIFDNKDFLYHECEQFLDLDIDHLSLYSLTIEENTKFFNSTNVKKEHEFDINEIYQLLIKNGFEHYEISNFGKKISKHNLGYWEYKPYIGCGCGAVEFDLENRYFNNSNLDDYIKNPFSKTTEHLLENDKRFEQIFLGLRSTVGIDINLINQTNINNLLHEDLIYIKDGKIYNKNFLLSDEIALYL
ncbi:MAG: coproporphyrinogen III oxidase family protein [Campylobacterales bacterium]|nr:coproporphyrinogen III oxidase family protein [Campylobacterales bacterium]